MEGIRGRVAIVTGGANGIGAGIVQVFANAGAHVVIADVAEPSIMPSTDSGTVDYQRTDLRSDVDVARVVSHTAAAHGGIDFLINVACTYTDGGISAERNAWRQAFDINLVGHVMLLQQARPYLARSQWASVVHFTSSSAHIAQAGRWTYPATKAAIAQLTPQQAKDLAPEGIRVNAVLPAWVHKQWQDTASPEVNACYDAIAADLHMLGRSASLDEIASVVMFLCSSHARHLSGICLKVDGGNTALGPQGIKVVSPGVLRQQPSTM